MNFDPRLGWLALAMALSACGKTEPKAELNQREERERAQLVRAKEACASDATYDRLKQVAFDEAIRIRNADPVNLDILSTHALVRVEQPVVVRRDDELDVTVCEGRMVLHVPPGAERAFAGKRQLEADIEYRAQAAADGSGLVYQLKGAEPIIASLAAFDLKGQAYRPPREAPAVAAAEPRASPVPASEPEPAPPPPPQPAPARTVEAQASPAPRPTDNRVAASPSFNCRYARSRSERMVCGSEWLAALDRTMSSQFYSALSRGDERTRTELRRSRDRFLARRDRCGDEDCVARAYRERMDEIAQIAARGGPSAVRVVRDYGPAWRGAVAARLARSPAGFVCGEGPVSLRPDLMVAPMIRP